MTRDIQDPETGKEALSIMNDVTLRDLAEEMDIEYIYMDDPSNIEYLLDSIKSGSTMQMASSDNVSYEDTYFYYAGVLLAFLLIEMVIIVRKGRV